MFIFGDDFDPLTFYEMENQPFLDLMEPVWENQIKAMENRLRQVN